MPNQNGNLVVGLSVPQASRKSVGFLSTFLNESAAVDAFVSLAFSAE